MDDATPTRTRTATTRIIAAVALALAFALGVYLLLEATQPVSGLVSFSFLLILPAAICAFVAYVADPFAERSKSAYMRIPLWLLGAVVVLSLFVLREGVICVILLAPLWLISGIVGTSITYALRRRADPDGRLYCSALILLPLLATQVEPYIPLPTMTAVVSRSIIVNAPPARIWPLLLGIPDVRPGEGRWTLSQDLIGIPKPVGAHLVGQGIGADRYARWEQDVRFRERITQWEPGRAIAWRFIFDDIAGWAYTDRHLMPNSAYFRVTTGGYRMEPIGDGRTRVVIHTTYRVTTPVNGYSRLWGELFLGDVENNLLSLVKQRAERPRPAQPST